jgi:hypothetical protein
VVVWSIDGNTLTQALGEKPLPVTRFLDTKPTWRAMGLNPGLEDERLETNCLIHGTAHLDAN